MRIARDDGSRLAEWWYSVDRVGLGLALLLVAGSGLAATRLASLAPTSAFDDWRTLLLSRGGVTVVALFLVVGLSMSTPRGMRRLALVAWFGGLVALLWQGVPASWLDTALLAEPALLAAMMAAPASVVLVGWALAGMEERPDLPAATIALVLLAVTAGAAIVAGYPCIGAFVLISSLPMICFVEIDRGRKMRIGLAVFASFVAVAGLALNFEGASIHTTVGVVPRAEDGPSLSGDPGGRIVAALQLVGLAALAVRALGASGAPGPSASRVAAVGLVVLVSVQGLAAAMPMEWGAASSVPGSDAPLPSLSAPVVLAFSLGLLAAATRRHPRAVTEALLARRGPGIDRGEARAGSGRT